MTLLLGHGASGTAASMQPWVVALKKLGVNAIARREHQVVHDRAAAGLDLEAELDHAGGIRSGAMAGYHTPGAEPCTGS